VWLWRLKTGFIIWDDNKRQCNQLKSAIVLSIKISTSFKILTLTSYDGCISTTSVTVKTTSFVILWLLTTLICAIRLYHTKLSTFHTIWVSVTTITKQFFLFIYCGCYTKTHVGCKFCNMNVTKDMRTTCTQRQPNCTNECRWNNSWAYPTTMCVEKDAYGNLTQWSTSWLKCTHVILGIGTLSNIFFLHIRM
jgi:hypothetical protein